MGGLGAWRTTGGTGMVAAEKTANGGAVGEAIDASAACAS